MTQSLDPIPDNTPLEQPTRLGYVRDTDTGRILVYTGTIRSEDGRMRVWLPEGVTAEEVGIAVVADNGGRE